MPTGRKFPWPKPSWGECGRCGRFNIRSRDRCPCDPLVDTLIPVVEFPDPVVVNAVLVLRWCGAWLLCDVARWGGENWVRSRDPAHLFSWVRPEELFRKIGGRSVGITFHHAADVPAEFLSGWARRRLAGE